MQRRIAVDPKHVIALITAFNEWSVKQAFGKGQAHMRLKTSAWLKERYEGNISLNTMLRWFHKARDKKYGSTFTKALAELDGNAYYQGLIGQDPTQTSEPPPPAETAESDAMTQAMRLFDIADRLTELAKLKGLTLAEHIQNRVGEILKYPAAKDALQFKMERNKQSPMTQAIKIAIDAITHPAPASSPSPQPAAASPAPPSGDWRLPPNGPAPPTGFNLRLFSTGQGGQAGSSTPPPHKKPGE